jgi:hypothetical protein
VLNSDLDNLISAGCAALLQPAPYTRFSYNSAVWKQALDGLVTLASPQALEVLKAAKTRQFSQQKDTEEFHRWLDEAIEQAESEVHSQ